MTETSTERMNPFVGPRNLEIGENIYGREGETAELLNLLTAERIVLLYSPSGAGKTSLIKASLIPQLIQRDFRVLPVLRVNQDPPPNLIDKEGFNRYVFSLLNHLEDSRPEGDRLDEETLTGIRLDDYMTQYTEGLLVLIFDQFEEILTLNPTDSQAKQEFFNQVGQALMNPTRWALFSMREDYLAGLDPYLLPVPSRLKNNFRLELLDRGASYQVIKQTAAQGGVNFTEPAANKLIDDLSRLQVQRPDGVLEIRLGEFVEPVQLQVVCYYIWGKLDPKNREITEDDIESLGNVDHSLAEYYSGQVSVIAEKTGVSVRRIRDWFEHELITETGIRSQVLMGSEKSRGLEERVIPMLESVHIVRRDTRRGTTWFELTHDRLIKPVRKSNNTWFQENLNLLQRQAGLWEKEDHPETLLLRDQALLDAETWAANHPNELSGVDQNFLEESRKARALVERERQEQAQKLELANKLAEAECKRAQEQEGSARRLRRILALTLIALAAAVVLGILAFNFSNQAQQAELKGLEKQATADTADAAALRFQAEREASEVEAHLAQQEATVSALHAQEEAALAASQARVALANQFALNSLEAQRSFPQRSLLSAIEGLLVTINAKEADSPVAYQALVNALTNIGGSVLTGHTDGVFYAVISPDNHWLATGSLDNTARLWDLTAVDPAASSILLEGHKEPIFAMAISPDSRWLATGGGDNTARLWDLKSIDPAKSSILLGEQGGDIASITFTPDGGRLITGSTDGTAHIWEMDASGPAADPTILAGGQKGDFSVAVSPDGRWLATGSTKGITRVWKLDDLDPTSEPIELDCHEPSSLEGSNAKRSILTVAFSRDGRWLATGSQDAMTCLWDLLARDPAESPWRMNGHLGEIRVVAFSPDSRWLASGSKDRTVRLWNLEQTDPTINSQVLRGHLGGIFTLAFSPDSRWLATGSADFTTRVWDLLEPDPAAAPLVHYGHENTVRSVAISSDGRWLATASMDHTARLWDLASHAVSALPIRLPGTASDVLALDYSPDGRWLVTGNRDDTVHLWDVSTSEPISSTLHSQVKKIRALEFSPDGRWLAAGGLDKGANLWEVTTSDPITSPTHLSLDDKILTLAFSEDGSRLAVGGVNDRIRLWDLSAPVSPDSDNELLGHKSDITTLKFSPDGHWLASGSQDGDVRLWNASSFEPYSGAIPLLDHSNKGVTALEFSPDSQMLASAGAEGAVNLYTLDHSSGISSSSQLLGHSEGAISLDFSPNSRWLASGSADQTIRLYDMTSSDPAIDPIILRGHLMPVLSVDFSPDGNWLATGGDEGTVFLWDMNSSNPAGNPRRLPGKNKIWEVTFSPDGKVIATANQGGVTRLWLPITQDLIDLACDTTGRNMTLAEWQHVLPGVTYRKTCAQWPEGH